MSIKEKLALAAQECQQTANISAANPPASDTSGNNDAARKIRTQRLIQLGAISDQYLGKLSKMKKEQGTKVSTMLFFRIKA